MKLFLLLSVLTITSLCRADSFTIIRDDKQYLCEQQGAIDPGQAADCATKAYSGPFSKDESVRLCQGARSVAPADCAIKAYSGPYSRDEAIQLCQRAKTLGPVDCATKAYGGPFSRLESISLCQGNGTLANADCAIKAYSGPYSREEALQMCKEQPMLVMRSLKLIEQSADLKQKVDMIKNKIQLREQQVSK